MLPYAGFAVDLASHSCSASLAEIRLKFHKCKEPLPTKLFQASCSPLRKRTPLAFRKVKHEMSNAISTLALPALAFELLPHPTKSGLPTSRTYGHACGCNLEKSPETPSATSRNSTDQYILRKFCLSSIVYSRRLPPRSGQLSL